MNYPATEERLFKISTHDVEIDDPFVWLEDKDNPEVLKWVAQQNEYTSKYFSEAADDFNTLKAKLKNANQRVEYSFEYLVGESIIAVKKDEQHDYCIVKLNKQYEQERVLLKAEDLNNKYSLFGVVPSPTNPNLCLIYAIPHGAPRPSYLLCNIQTKELLAELKNSFSAVWNLDGTEVYYSDAEIDTENNRNINYVKRFTVATHTEETVYTEKENAPFLLLQLSPRTGDVIVKVCHDYSNASLLRIEHNTNVCAWIIKGIQGSFGYIGETAEDYLIHTNYNAPLGNIIAINKSILDFDQRKVIVDEAKYNIEGAISNGKIILINYLKNAASLLQIYTIENGLVETVHLPEQYCSISGVGGFGGSHLLGNRYIVLTYESFLTKPSRIWFDFDSKSLQINEYSNAFEQLIEVKQFFAKSHDGELIPYYTVYPKDISLNGENAVLMYGYGGYNVSILPSFDNPFIGLNIVNWVQEGHIYVSCNLRGGSEFGSKWHENGCLKNKKNVFFDFIAIAETLIEQGWTKKSKIAICGGSNGGLLTTALTTMRPDLWGAVIASVPHTDMIRFKNDDRGFMYITEYGNPDDKEMFDYLLSYSPYHNVKKEKYPAIYIQTGEMDNNVPPYHGKKFAAKMQKLNISENPVLLRVLAEGSHDRGKGEVMFNTHAEMQLFIKQHLKI